MLQVDGLPEIPPYDTDNKTIAAWFSELPLDAWLSSSSMAARKTVVMLLRTHARIPITGIVRMKLHERYEVLHGIQKRVKTGNRLDALDEK
jgi:hypothetical protein